MRRLLAGAALAVPLLVPLAPGRAAPPCAVDLERRNSWHLVSTSGAVGMDDANPCRVLAVGPQQVLASDDGGASFRESGPAPAAPARLVTSGLPSGSALLVAEDGSLWSTADRGEAWARSTGLAGAVQQLAVSELAPTRVLAVVAPQAVGPALPVPAPVAPPVVAGSTLYLSDNGGRSFVRVQGATGLSVTTALFDAGVPSRWWLGVSGPAGGLFVSDDLGGTFTPVATGSVAALASSRLAGGGSEVVAATSDGVLVSRDGGRSVAKHLTGTAVTGIALEWQHPSAGLLLSGNVRRTSDNAVSARGQSDGLPTNCEPSNLRRDRSVPSAFLVDCVEGSTWRYRSDGTDLTATDMPDGTALPQTPQVLRPTPVQMRELARHRLPQPGSRQDGSIASDGDVLYYADQEHVGVVHRMVARTGKALPDLRTRLRRPVGHLAYDANRNHLLMLDTALVIWDLPLSGGAPVKLFHAPLSGRSEEDDEQSTEQGGPLFYGAMTYDSATDRLLFGNDGADSFTEYDRQGHERNNCPHLGLDQVVTLGNNPAYEASIAGMVATGDGLVYIEAEDDSSVIRVDRSCRALATFQHEYFSEAPAENDGIACDTTTFDTPAIWLRDARKAIVVAYSVEAGYCALPSAVTVHAPPGVATGQAGEVCATLVLPAKHKPLAGQAVDLLVAGRGIGSPVTDRKGKACATYRPLASEAGAGRASSRSRQPVLAAFLGTPAYRPASARASLVVSRAVAVPPPPPVEAQPAAPPVLAAPPPPPPVQPPQPPPPAPQQQPVTQPQGHPGAQPGAMGQLGAAAMPEDEPEAAAQGADTHLMTALDWEAYALPSAFGVLAFAAAQRRRRASRVRGQSA
ncbi:MAG TPA: hypothetical protein VM097_07215 [Mycobacteriales bacterium]|nr:hypothetical protein [Mycobacteriales bacterium]